MYLLLILSIATLAVAEIDPARDQLVLYNSTHSDSIGTLTTTHGAPVYSNEVEGTFNTRLLYNTHFIESITHVVRERTPERVVHAKGTGAFGYFEVTKNISHICKADFLKQVGEKTPVAVRFSQTVGERGSNDLLRGVRGIAIKLYTREGNFDLVCFNFPVFPFKDPLLFTPFVHAARRNPATNLMDNTMFWDQTIKVKESLHFHLYTFSDIGLPASYRFTPAFPIHLYPVVNALGKRFYMRFHIKPKGGIKNLLSREAKNISSSDPDYLTRDLYTAIAKGDYPIWDVFLQTLSDADVDTLGSRAWDVSRTISTDQFPLTEVGKIILNKNPKNHFAEIEQLAFCPANVVPGICPPPDKLYEARMFAYQDAQRYRLGKNFNEIPVNCPLRARTLTYNRDGASPVNANGRDAPNYYPNSFNGPVPLLQNKTCPGEVQVVKEADNMDQSRDYYASLADDEKLRLANNIIDNLSGVSDVIQQKAVQFISEMDTDLGNFINQGLQSSESD